MEFRLTLVVKTQAILVMGHPHLVLAGYASLKMEHSHKVLARHVNEF